MKRMGALVLLVATATLVATTSTGAATDWGFSSSPRSGRPKTTVVLSWTAQERGTCFGKLLDECYEVEVSGPSRCPYLGVQPVNVRAGKRFRLRLHPADLMPTDRAPKTRHVWCSGTYSGRVTSPSGELVAAFRWHIAHE
jgi:hypothetical protein